MTNFMSYRGGTEARGTDSRRAALRMLDAVLNRGQRLDVAHDAFARALMLPEDRAFALALASEALRWLVDLDRLIDGATRLSLAPDAKARNVLRLALVQALRLGTPAHAAIATALELVTGGPKRLVHGVFGTLMRQGAALPARPTLPVAVVERWQGWGDDMLADAAFALTAPPALSLSWKDGRNEVLQPDTRLEDVSGWAEGDCWVQNPAAAVPASLLGAGEGRHVLDLCAAPGGKTLQLAAAGWRVTALDQSGKRLERLRDNLARTRLEADIVEADLLAWQPDASVDAVLLDAPCTATGTFARHPDVLHRIGGRDIATLAEVQARMLARAATWLKPGGLLVFATCSLEREEGEAVAAGCPLPPAAVTRASLGQVTPQGGLRILPAPGIDGFFVARFRAPD